MTGYPAQEEEEHFKDETEQNKEWFQNAEIFRNLPAELAVELDHPKLYEQYLTRPIERFMKEYWQQHELKMRGSWEDDRIGCISATNSVHIYFRKKNSSLHFLRKQIKNGWK